MRTLQIVCLHLALYAIVVGYLFLGAIIFSTIEGTYVETADNVPEQKAEKLEQTEPKEQHHHSVLFDDDQLIGLSKELSIKLGINREQLFTILKAANNPKAVSEEEEEKTEPVELSSDAVTKQSEEKEKMKWSFSSSLLFSFTILTTIGYGHVTPLTFAGRLFTIFYALFGIPLFLIALTDLGTYVKSIFVFVFRLLTRCCKKSKRSKVGTLEKRSEEENSQKSQILRALKHLLLIMAIFICFILLGAAIMPWWEDLSTFDAAYYTFISISTIGFGDIVPQNMRFLPLTLLYITIGLWLTTIVIQKISDIFKLFHFAGRRLTNVDDVDIWVGGKKMTVGEVIMAVGLKTGVPKSELEMIDWDDAINDAADGILPPEQPKKEPLPPSPYSSMPVTPQSFRKSSRHFPPIDSDVFATGETDSLMEVVA